MKFVVTIADTASTTKSQHLVKDDIEAGLSAIMREIALGTVTGVCRNKAGVSIGNWGLSTTSTSSYSVIP